MTERQRALYQYLVDHKNENRFIPKLELAMNLGYSWCIGSQRNGVAIEYDVRALNNDEIDYIIISNAEGYKIGTSEEEINEYLDNIKIQFLNKIKRYKAIKKRLVRNGFIYADESPVLKEFNSIG